MHFCPSRSRIPSLEAIKQTKTWIKRLFFQNGLCYSKRTSTFAKFPPLSSLVLQSDRHKTSTSQNMSTEYTRELGDFRRSCTLPWQRWTWNFAARILTPPRPPLQCWWISDHEDMDFGVDFGAAGPAEFGHSATSEIARFCMRFLHQHWIGGAGGRSKNGDSTCPALQSLVAKMYPLHLHSEMFWCILWRPFLLSANAPCLNIESGSRREGSGAALQTRRRCRDWTKISIFALAVGAETGPKLVFSRSP